MGITVRDGIGVGIGASIAAVVVFIIRLIFGGKEETKPAETTKPVETKTAEPVRPLTLEETQKIGADVANVVGDKVVAELQKSISELSTSVNEVKMGILDALKKLPEKEGLLDKLKSSMDGWNDGWIEKVIGEIKKRDQSSGDALFAKFKKYLDAKNKVINSGSAMKNTDKIVEVEAETVSFKDESIKILDTYLGSEPASTAKKLMLDKRAASGPSADNEVNTMVQAMADGFISTLKTDQMSDGDRKDLDGMIRSKVSDTCWGYIKQEMGDKF